MDEPCFVVRDSIFGREHKIWADGRIEGFGPAATVINRIPQVVAAAVEEAVDEVRSAHDIPGEDR